MLIILSPAKTIDISLAGNDIPATTPRFAEEAEYLAGEMRKFSVAELEKLLKISDKLALETHERYLQFGTPDNPRVQALFAYNGSVFKAIEPRAFTPADFDYAQDHLRVVSTLYGLLRPLDRIEAYRIAFNVKLDGEKGRNLYDYWLPRLTDPLVGEVKKSGGILVNLASIDIQGALQMDIIRKNVT